VIIVNGKELQWKAGLTIQDLALQSGGAPGASFAALGTLPVSAVASATSAGTSRARLVSRLEWPLTQVPDGVAVKFMVIPSGG
jgi:hypothetical protein